MNVMTLLHPDSTAKDPLYNKIQEGFPNVTPPTLFKEHVEKLFEISGDLMDRKFREQIKHNFASCYSELLFASVFRRRLAFLVSHPSDEGPDLFINEIGCWAEVVTMSDSQAGNPNSIPQTILGEVSEVPQKQIILRITNSFTYKADKFRKYLNDGLIRDTEEIVICISGGWFGGSNRIPTYIKGGFPPIVSALLAMGNVVFLLDKNTHKIIDQTCEFRDRIPKVISESNTEPIKTDYFLDPNFSYISGVIYSWANVNEPIDDLSLGNDFYFVHNPITARPIPVGSFKCGIEYDVKFDGKNISIKTINHNL
jgi:hypothetical protein